MLHILMHKHYKHRLNVFIINLVAVFDTFLLVIENNLINSYKIILLKVEDC